MLPPTIEARAPVNGVGRARSSVQDDASGRRVITESSGSGPPPLNPPTTTKACGITVSRRCRPFAIFGLVVMMMVIRVIMMVMTVTPQWREGQRKHGSICSWATEAAPLQIPWSYTCKLFLVSVWNVVLLLVKGENINFIVILRSDCKAGKLNQKDNRLRNFRFA